MAVEKPNILLVNTVTDYPYTSQYGKSEPNIPRRDNPRQHAITLKDRLNNAYKQYHELTPPQIAAIKYRDGICLDISGQQGHDLIIKSLENMKAGIRLLNVRYDETNQVTHAAVYIPKGKESFFIDRLDNYAETIETGKPKNQLLINSIEDIKLALLETFWIGKQEDMPTDTPFWCEAWISTDNDNEAIETAFSDICQKLEIPLSDKTIVFPERIVKLIRSNSSQLTDLIKYFAHISELRRAEEATSFFDELSSADQKAWTDEALSRMEYDLSDASVCILDTGINAGHPFLVNACDEDCIQTVDPSWGNGDHHGHGTEVAGIALFYDLKEKLVSDKKERIVHHLESVKILPPRGENDPLLYGAITQNAVYMAELVRPQYKRAICMSVTSKEHNTGNGRPTSWSGAVDSLIAGVNDDTKRLFFISAGNVYPDEIKQGGYPDANVIHSVESPGQAWNAITVGAYNKDIIIEDKKLEEYQPVAQKGDISPYTSTSLMWERGWPIKPEIICNGGNMATDKENYTEAADLSLLTTYFRPTTRLFSTIHGTSSAAAQAAWMAAQIIAEYPDIWPETVRALLIHSSRWTKEMRQQFCPRDTNKTDRRLLLRTCGYGIPRLERAIECLSNNVNMIVQEELQPYGKKSMNNMNIHKIPWPSEVLQAMGDTTVTMRVTLSYFIEPGPGEIGWKNKYRYQSCGLRFDVINKDETEEDFKKRIDVEMRGEDKKDKGEGTSGAGNWYLGPKNRDVGSIHSDFMMQYAVDLCNKNYIAVYPVVGWWRERTNLKCFDKTIRYSLIVSIFTPETSIDFYTPIINQIETSGTIPIEIKV